MSGECVSFLSNPYKFDWVWGQIAWAISDVLYLVHGSSVQDDAAPTVDQDSGDLATADMHCDDQGVVVRKVHGAGICF